MVNERSYRSYRTYDSKIGWLYVPNSKFRILSDEATQGSYFIRTNKSKFRSNFEFRKDKEKQRIVFLGDSYTAGTGVNNEDRFTDLIDSRLEDIECYNFGLGSSGIDQQILIYENISTKFDHDVIFLSFHLVDLLRFKKSIDGFDGNEPDKVYKYHKPYFEFNNSVMTLKNIPVPKIEKKERDLGTKNVKSKGSSVRILSDRAFDKILKSPNIPFSIKEATIRSKKKYKLNYEPWANNLDENVKKVNCLLDEFVRKYDSKKIVLCPLIDARTNINLEYSQMFKEFESKYDHVSFINISDKLKNYKNSVRWKMHLMPYTFSGGHYSEFGHQVLSRLIIKNLKSLNIIESQESKSASLSKKNNEDIYILGISAFYHDSAASLIKNGNIVAAVQEERFSRIKNDTSFPSMAINYCMEEADIEISQLSSVVFYDIPMVSLERIISSHISVSPRGQKIWEDMIPNWVSTKMRIPEIIAKEINYDGTIDFVSHHISHAASAFYPSKFKEAAIVTVDGVGEWTTTSISIGKGNKIKQLKKLDYPHSIGLLYSAFTYYCGFKVNRGEYKLMGLAPYGEPEYVDIIKDNIVTIKSDGSIRLNMDYFGFMENDIMTNSKFNQIFGGPPREEESALTQKEMNLAKSIQVVTEEIIQKICDYAHKLTSLDNLCLAGGVALNCVSNGKVLRNGKFKEIWIQPAAGDAGGSLGSALQIYYSKFKKDRLETSDTIQAGSYWGPSFSDDEIKSFLDSHDFKYKIMKDKERSKYIAKQISKGNVVGHFSGRMEFGPRALGARSIIGDPRSEKTQSLINLKIKYRESFRPFAPTVIEEKISEYFDLDIPSPYMLLVAPVKEERCLKVKSETEIIKKVNQKRSDIPAVTHVDYSARIQSINRKYNKEYYDIIKEFEIKTGYGVIVNTSFNVRGEPIVCTPKDAVNCFLSTEMDILAIGSFIIDKKAQEPKSVSASSVKKDIEIKESKFRFESKKLFDKYIKNVKASIDIKNDSDDLESYWLDLKDIQTFVEWPKYLSPESEVLLYLKNWNYIDSEKEMLRSLVLDLITLRNKLPYDAYSDSSVSHSVYAMY